MKLTLGFLLLCAPALWADSATCTGPLGVPLDCSASPLQLITNYPTFTTSGKTISSNTVLQILDPGNFSTPHDLGVSAAISVADRFVIPASPAGDVLKISGVFGEGGRSEDADPVTYALMLQFGPGSANSPQINLNPVDDFNTYCYKLAACEINTTVPASDFSYFSINASEYLFGNTNTGGTYSFLDEIFTISRFEADGTTPDPFAAAPEPASWAMLLVSGSALAVYRRKNCLTARNARVKDLEQKS